jgi:pyruvate-ferredoxin/flavodoxin oxidoreductase
MGANDTQTIRAFLEAEAYEGPSLIIAYCHCIAHGYDMRYGMEQQKAAVLSGYWPLLRYDPRRAREGKNPLQLDSKAPSLPLEEYIYNETRYTMLARSQPERAKYLLQLAEEDVRQHWRLYAHLASMPMNGAGREGSDD